MTVFIRVLDASVDDKDTVLREALHGRKGKIFDVDPMDFTRIPGTPFAYWVSSSLRDIFVRLSPFLSESRNTNVGASTTDDSRYLRTWHEVPASSIATGREATLQRKGSWALLAKDGSPSRFYCDISLCIQWGDNGRQLKSTISEYRGSRGWGYQWTAALNGHENYFRQGLTWPRRTETLSFRVLPAGAIFGNKCPAAFAAGDDAATLLAICAIANSSPFEYLVGTQMARTELARSYEVGLIQQTPVPELEESARNALGALAHRAWSLKRILDTAKESSHAFVLPAALRARAGAFDRDRIEVEIGNVQREIDVLAFHLYGIDGDDRTEIARWASKANTGAKGNSEPSDGDDADDTDTVETAANDRDAVLSWSVGVAFGRFDSRLATGERPIPPEPEPFDPLPTHSPGMLVEPYPSWRLGALTAPPPILVDDPGHTHDITAASKAVYELVHLDAPEDLRRVLAKDFFPLHIKMYSKSRRKAPIYWQLATPSASYSVWLYLHAFTKDTFYAVQNDYVAPKLRHEESKLETLRRDAGTTPSAAQRKELAAQEQFVDELRAFLEEVKRITPLWNPDLDDGVIINFAPLFRLVPHNRAWQKECKDCWDTLCAGEYDWAHLAMHLWPERVAPKCKTDRSLAIAHSLEDRLWVQDFDQKWRPRWALEETIAHVVDHYRSEKLASAIVALRAFWKHRFADQRRDDAAWWMELETGAHDDAPIAFAWWPDRVMTKALKDPVLARAHGLELGQPLPGTEIAPPAAGKRGKTRPERAPHLSSEQLSMVAAFCRDLEGYPSWTARWKAWDAGAFDDRSPLALAARTTAVVQRATEDHAVARTFGLERWFWIEAGEGARRLHEPEAELRESIAERTSPAVKAALKSLIEAPTAGAGAAGAKRGGGRKKREDAP